MLDFAFKNWKMSSENDLILNLLFRSLRVAWSSIAIVYLFPHGMIYSTICFNWRYFLHIHICTYICTDTCVNIHVYMHLIYNLLLMILNSVPTINLCWLWEITIHPWKHSQFCWRQNQWYKGFQPLLQFNSSQGLQLNFRDINWKKITYNHFSL